MKITNAKIRVIMKKNLGKYMHVVSVGGFTVCAEGREFSFDFHLSESFISRHDQKRVWFLLSKADEDSFPEMQDICGCLEKIDAFPECYIWVGDHKNEVSELESFSIICEGTGRAPQLDDTDFITFETEQENESYKIQCRFTKALLDTCEIVE